LLEKIFKHRVDLEFRLLNGANDRLPIEPPAGFWQSRPFRAEPKSDDDSNVGHHRTTHRMIDDDVDRRSSQRGRA